jgi:hypothetical protein
MAPAEEDPVAAPPAPAEAPVIDAAPADAAPADATAGAEEAAPGDRPGDIPFDQAVAEHENPELA